MALISNEKMDKSIDDAISSVPVDKRESLKCWWAGSPELRAIYNAGRSDVVKEIFTEIFTDFPEGSAHHITCRATLEEIQSRFLGGK